MIPYKTPVLLSLLFYMKNVVFADSSVRKRTENNAKPSYLSFQQFNKILSFEHESSFHEGVINEATLMMEWDDMMSNGLLSMEKNGPTDISISSKIKPFVICHLDDSKLCGSDRYEILQSTVMDLSGASFDFTIKELPIYNHIEDNETRNEQKEEGLMSGACFYSSMTPSLAKQITEKNVFITPLLPFLKTRLISSKSTTETIDKTTRAISVHLSPGQASSQKKVSEYAYSLLNIDKNKESETLVAKACDKDALSSTVVTISSIDASLFYYEIQGKDCIEAFTNFLTNQPEILSVELVPITESLNDVSSWIIQSFVENSRPWSAIGLNGENEIVQVSDSGLDVNHCYFKDATDAVPLTTDFDLTQGRIDKTKRKIVSYVALYEIGDMEDSGGHGSHVVGSILGKRTDNGINEVSGMVDGIASAAKVTFFDANDMSIHDNEKYFSIPLDISQMFYFGKQSQAFGHNASWGSNSNGGQYSSRSKEVDQYFYENQPDDFIMFVAAGNNGDVNGAKIDDPCVSKNLICVGASHSSGRDLSNGMLGADYVAAFSSRGPTVDGRIKPDVVGPGHAILSANANSGKCDPISRPEFDENESKEFDGVTFKSGTSMATPIVAGAGALIRQYFKEVYDTQMDISGTLLKAILVNGGEALLGRSTSIYGGSSSSSSTEYDEYQGYGRVNLLNSLKHPDIDSPDLYVEDVRVLQQGQAHEYEFGVCYSREFRVTIAWRDPPGTPGCVNCLVNDLDLEVELNGQIYHPNGKTGKDSKNNIERVILDQNEMTDSDIVSVRVKATNLGFGQVQEYSLVSTGCINNADFVTSTPSPTTSCGPDQFEYKLEMFTDRKPEETSFTLEYQGSGGIIDFSEAGYYDKRLYRYMSYGCADFNCFIFVIKDYEFNGLCCAKGMGMYRISVGDEILVEGYAFKDRQEIEKFCYYGSSTEEPTSSPTILCDNDEFEYHVDIKTDLFPDEIRWELRKARINGVDEGSYTEAGAQNIHRGCLNTGCYKIIINGYEGELNYVLFVGDDLIVEGEGGEGFFEDTTEFCVSGEIRSKSASFKNICETGTNFFYDCGFLATYECDPFLEFDCSKACAGCCLDYDEEFCQYVDEMICNDEFTRATCRISCNSCDEFYQPPDDDEFYQPSDDDECETGQVQYDFFITPGSYLEDVSWELVHSEYIIDSVPYMTYKNQLQWYSHTGCAIFDECYELRMFNKNQDGMCCYFGNGFYQLTAESETLVQGSQFHGDFLKPVEIFQRNVFCYPSRTWEARDPTFSPTNMICEDDEFEYGIRIRTHLYPFEISWEFSYNNGGSFELVDSVEEYEYWLEFYEYDHRGCLPLNTCYTFKIKSMSGEGICCDYGNGAYMIFANNVLITQGGDFDNDYDLVQFCSNPDFYLQHTYTPTSSSNPTLSIYPSSHPSVPTYTFYPTFFPAPIPLAPASDDEFRYEIVITPSTNEGVMECFFKYKYPDVVGWELPDEYIDDAEHYGDQYFNGLIKFLAPLNNLEKTLSGVVKYSCFIVETRFAFFTIKDMDTGSIIAQSTEPFGKTRFCHYAPRVAPPELENTEALFTISLTFSSSLIDKDEEVSKVIERSVEKILFRALVVSDETDTTLTVKTVYSSCEEFTCDVSLQVDGDRELDVLAFVANTIKDVLARGELLLITIQTGDHFDIANFDSLTKDIYIEFDFEYEIWPTSLPTSSPSSTSTLTQDHCNTPIIIQNLFGVVSNIFQPIMQGIINTTDPMSDILFGVESHNSTTVICKDKMFILELEIQTDGSPGKTSWELLYENGTIIDSIGQNTYSECDTSYNHSYCLDTSCFVFNMLDSFEFKGHYNITVGDTVLAQQDSFQWWKDSKRFCYPLCDEENMFAIQIELITDTWPQETSWALAFENGTLVESVDKSYYTRTNTSYNHRYCLRDGCYDVTFHDHMGDGICCSYGEGSFKIKIDDKVIREGGEFEDGDKKSFCHITPEINIEESTSLFDFIAGLIDGNSCCEDITTTGYPTPYPTTTAKPSSMLSSMPSSNPSTSNPTSFCDDNEFRYTIFIDTDDYPEETSWTLTYIDDGTLIDSVSEWSYSQPYYKYTHKGCIDLDRCVKYTIKDSYGDGINAGGYTIMVKDYIVVEVFDFLGTMKSEEFCYPEQQ